MKNKFILILLSFIPICSQVIKSNTSIYQSNNTTLSNGSGNNLKDSDDENVGAKLSIINNVVNMPQNVHATYGLQFDTYENNDKIVSVRVNDLDIKSATYLITNKVYLSKTNNYTFQINVDDTSWHNVTINRDSMHKVNDTFSSIKITGYSLFFNWTFNLETQTFQLKINKNFTYYYTYTNKSTGYIGDAHSMTGSYLVNPSQYTYNYILPPSPNPTPPNNQNSDIYQGVLYGLVAFAFVLFAAIIIIASSVAIRIRLRTWLNSNRLRLMDEPGIKYFSRSESILGIRDSVPLEDPNYESSVIDSNDKTPFLNSF